MFQRTPMEDMLSSRIPTRREQRQMLFAPEHPSNNRKRTAGRCIQEVFNKKQGKIVQMRYNP